MDDSAEAGFRDFATTSAAGLRRFAYLLCGDWHLAEDLTQTTLLKIYRSWRKLRHDEAIAHYVRRTLLRTWLDEKRKPWRRRESGHDVVPEVADGTLDPAARAERLWARTVVQRGLLEVPPKQRAVLVLRYFDELSVAETAAVLGCSEGNVKSQTARGLAALARIVDRLEPGKGLKIA
ncbi:MULTISPECIES: RNA polymerase sigma factor [Amycolatopsis]|uniref:RNA polymerase sigma-70 factor, sigma-E family n=2 Tax=Amycolatopsis TaxID=1813 RepID=A0A1I3TTQ8_9PSEU|nr:SigE family RNA polymerase sigma factor [Amycolatopsis sacchari]SFJ72927.1 RNA polymerase sigma-70 factor, sigma-E family [Amycolatopsis sacchari]